MTFCALPTPETIPSTPPKRSNTPFSSLRLASESTEDEEAFFVSGVAAATPEMVASVPRESGGGAGAKTGTGNSAPMPVLVPDPACSEEILTGGESLIGSSPG